MGVLTVQVEFEPRFHFPLPEGGEVYLYTFPNNCGLRVESDLEWPGRWKASPVVWYLDQTGTVCSTNDPRTEEAGPSPALRAPDLSGLLVGIRQLPPVTIAISHRDDGTKEIDVN